MAAKCPGEEQDFSPRRDRRERRCPWVFLSIIVDPAPTKALVRGMKRRGCPLKGCKEFFQARQAIYGPGNQHRLRVKSWAE